MNKKRAEFVYIHIRAHGGDHTEMEEALHDGLLLIDGAVQYDGV